MKTLSTKTRIFCLILSLLMFFTFSYVNVHSDESTDETTTNAAIAGRAAVEDVLPDFLLDSIGEEQLNKTVGVKDFDSDDMSSVTLINEDGSYSLLMFSQPIKYVADDDEIKFIDNKIVESNDGFKNNGNGFDAKFSKDVNDGVLLSESGYTMTMKPVVNDETEMQNAELLDIRIVDANRNEDGEIVEYANVFGGGTALQYELTNTGIKESIFVEKPNGIYEYQFLIEVPGLVPDFDTETEQIRQIEFIDEETKEPVFTIMPTFIVDSSEEMFEEDYAHITYENYYQIEELENGKYLLTMILDKDFLENSKTVYPIIIDPTVTLYGLSGGAFDDCYYYANHPNGGTPGTWPAVTGTELRVGMLGSMGQSIIYIKPKTMQMYNHINPNNITAAIYVTKNILNTGSFLATTIDAHESTTNINISTSNYNTAIAALGNAISGSSVSLPAAYFDPRLPPPDPSQYPTCPFGITNLVKNWMDFALNQSGFTQARGFFLKASVHNGLTRALASATNSGNYAYIQITYNEETNVANGVYYLRNKSTGTYLTANTSGSNNTVTHTAFSGTNGQRWKLQATNGYYTLVNELAVHNTKRLTENSSNSSAVLSINTGITAQIRIVSNTDGTYRLQSKYYGYFGLTAGSGSACSFTAYDGLATKKWELETYIPDGIYYIRNKGSGLYLTAGAGWLDLTQQNLSGEATQQLKLTYTNGRYRMQPMSRTGANMSIPDSLDVLGGSSTGGSVIITSNNNTAAQSWAIIALPTGGYRIRPDCGIGTSLSVASNPPGIGSNLQTQMASNSVFQVWELEKFEPISDGVYYIRNKQTGNYLRPDGSVNCGTGAWNDLKDQQWKIAHQGNGLYRLYTQHPSQLNKMLFSNSSSVSVSSNATNETLYYLQLNTDGTYRILSAHMNTSLHNNSNTAACIYTTSDSSNNQKWELARREAVYNIKNVGSKLYMTAGSNNNYVTQQSKNNQKGQRWLATYNNGKYRLQPNINYSNNSLDVNNGSSGIAYVNIWNNNNSSAQSWNIEYISYGKYKLKPECGNNTALSIEGESLNVNARTKTDFSSNSDFQKWEFEEFAPNSSDEFSSFAGVFYLADNNDAKVNVNAFKFMGYTNSNYYLLNIDDKNVFSNKMQNSKFQVFNCHGSPGGLFFNQYNGTPHLDICKDKPSNPNPNPNVLYIDDLDLSNTDLMILRACSTAKPLPNNEKNICQKLNEDKGVRVVIGWPIDTHTGYINWMKVFYEYLFEGMTIENAVNQTNEFWNGVYEEPLIFGDGNFILLNQ